MLYGDQLPVREQWLLQHAAKQHADRDAIGGTETTAHAPRHRKGDECSAKTSAALVQAKQSVSSGAPPNVSRHPAGSAHRVIKARRPDADELAAVNGTKRDSGEITAFGGDAAAPSTELLRAREGELIAAMEHANIAIRQRNKLTAAAIRIQTVIRMFSERRRFVAHQAQLKAEVAAIIAQRNMRCAITVQRIVRGLVCRLQYRRQREEEALLAMETAKAKGKGRKGGKGPAGANATAGGSADASLSSAPPDASKASGTGGGGFKAILSPQEMALQQNANFIAGVRKLMTPQGASLDDVLALFEQQQKLRPEPVTLSMIALVKRKRDGATAATDAKGGPNASTASLGSKGKAPGGKAK
jgi:hypothetical protein